MEQEGFRKDFSTIDHIFTLDQLIEKANKYKIEMNFIFIGFSRAFDSIEHTGDGKPGYPQKMGLNNQGNIPKS